MLPTIFTFWISIFFELNRLYSINLVIFLGFRMNYFVELESWRQPKDSPVLKLSQVKLSHVHDTAKFQLRVTGDTKQKCCVETQKRNVSRIFVCSLNNGWSSLAIRRIFSNYGTSIPTIPQKRFTKGWIHESNVFRVQNSKAEMILLGDSIICGLDRYPSVLSCLPSTLNLGVGGDRTQNVLWRLQDGKLPISAKYLVVQVGTNNVDFDSAKDIADGIYSIALVGLEVKPGVKVLVCGVRPRQLYPGLRRAACEKVNHFLKKRCASANIKNIYYVEPGLEWVWPSGVLNKNLFHTDFLHLSMSENVKFVSEIAAMVNKIYSKKIHKRLGCN